MKPERPRPRRAPAFIWYFLGAAFMAGLLCGGLGGPLTTKGTIGALVGLGMMLYLGALEIGEGR